MNTTLINEVRVTVETYEVPGGFLAIAKGPTGDAIQWSGGVAVSGRPEARFCDGTDPVSVRVADSPVWHLVVADCEVRGFTKARAEQLGFYFGL